MAKMMMTKRCFSPIGLQVMSGDPNTPGKALKLEPVESENGDVLWTILDGESMDEVLLDDMDDVLAHLKDLLPEMVVRVHGLS